MECTYKHWIPLITRCPLSIFPDFGYVSVTSSKMIELFALRKIIFSYKFKKIFMEDLVRSIQTDILQTSKGLVIGEFIVTYTLLFGRVKVKI